MSEQRRPGLVQQPHEISVWKTRLAPLAAGWQPVAVGVVSSALGTGPAPSSFATANPCLIGATRAGLMSVVVVQVSLGDVGPDVQDGLRDDLGPTAIAYVVAKCGLHRTPGFAGADPRSPPTTLIAVAYVPASAQCISARCGIVEPLVVGTTGVSPKTTRLDPIVVLEISRVLRDVVPLAQSNLLPISAASHRI